MAETEAEKYEVLSKIGTVSCDSNVLVLVWLTVVVKGRVPLALYVKFGERMMAS